MNNVLEAFSCAVPTDVSADYRDILDECGENVKGAEISFSGPMQVGPEYQGLQRYDHNLWRLLQSVQRPRTRSFVQVSTS